MEMEYLTDLPQELITILLSYLDYKAFIIIQDMACLKIEYKKLFYTRYPTLDYHLVYGIELSNVDFDPLEKSKSTAWQSVYSRLLFCHSVGIYLFEAAITFSSLKAIGLLWSFIKQKFTHLRYSHQKY